MIFLSYFIEGDYSNERENFGMILEYMINSLSESGESASLAFISHEFFQTIFASK